MGGYTIGMTRPHNPCPYCGCPDWDTITTRVVPPPPTAIYKCSKCRTLLPLNSGCLVIAVVSLGVLSSLLVVLGSGIWPV